MLSKIAARLVALLLLAAPVWLFLSVRPLRHAPGVLVKEVPSQTNIAPKPLGQMGGWRVIAMAKYHLCGRVLGTKRYYNDPQAELVPVDVAVGWRQMSDQSVLDRLGISMSNRFYFYEWPDEPPIPQDVIKVSSANNHVIAANPEVRKLIRGLRHGQILTMDGYLVNATGPEGRAWNSSLTREDTGNGACELFYVESAKVVDRIDGEG